MTDQPRFVPYNGHPDSAHFHYHGGPLVDAIFRLADRWQAMRNRSAAGAVSDDASELSRPIPVPISAIETLDEFNRGNSWHACQWKRLLPPGSSRRACCLDRQLLSCSPRGQQFSKKNSTGVFGDERGWTNVP